MKYDVILFDADGTLMDFHRGESEAVRMKMAEMGIEPTDELASEYSKINESLWKMLERKEITKPELLVRRFEIFCERFGFSVDAEKMARSYENALSQKGYLFDGAEYFEFPELCDALTMEATLDFLTQTVAESRSGLSVISPLED